MTKRDIELRLAASTEGAESITDLGRQLQGVGKAAGESAPAIDALSAELDALAVATARRRTDEAAARTDAAATRKALSDQSDALARLRAESNTATRSTAEFEDAERRLRLQIIEGRAAVRDKAGAVAAATAETRAAVAAERQVADQLQRTRAEHLAAGAAARQHAAATTETTTASERLGRQLSALRNIATAALGGSLIGSLAGDVGRTADAYNNLAARIKLVTGEGDAFTQAFEGVQAVAQRTGAALESTGTLFARVAQAGKEIGLSQRDALALTETINQAVALSGSSAQASEAAITQLIQGLQSGVLRGEEFNSVMEQSPRLARALADGVGVTTGELRKLAQQGVLTSETVIKALQGQGQAIRQEAESLPPTVGRAVQSLSNAWTVYVGAVDSATGASSAAAGAIKAIAENLDTLGAVLFSAGKAAAAYAAIRLAQSFIETRAAVVASTVAVAANTAALTANAAAGAATAATVGRIGSLVATLGTVLGGLKLAALVAVLTNLRALGTYLGETAAKLAGYSDATSELEARQKAQEGAARSNSEAMSALAASTALATDKALGLNKESKALAGKFDELVKKGDTASEAVGKLAKELRLGDLKGIGDAGAALDALALRGKITAQEVRDALGAALKGEDLAKFEVQARAAFDGSAQGARRLQAVLDAIATESLTRAGTSVKELQTGFTQASVSAINDLDALRKTLDDLKVTGDTAGRALGASVDKALAAATTEQAVRALIQRLEDMGRTGQLAGDRLSGALDAAKKKIDDLKPGINSLSEALRAFGLQTRAELTATAARLESAYIALSQSAEVSLADQAKAYGAWRDAALRASGGVETGQLQLQRIILENRGAVADLGRGIEEGMTRGRRATDTATASQERLTAAMRAGSQVADNTRQSVGAGQESQGGLTKIESFGDLIRNTPSGGITRTAIVPGQYTPAQQEFINQPQPRQTITKTIDGQTLTLFGYIPQGGSNGKAGTAPFGQAARAAGGYEVRFVLPGGTKTATVGSAGDAESLVRELQEAFRQAGGS